MGAGKQDGHSGISYADACVDISAGNALVEAIKPLARATARIGTDSALGGFGGLFDLKACGFKDPVLVAANDGVGTKLRIAIDAGLHRTVGIDLVAMSVNDLIVQGAEPLFFLDYFATGKLRVDEARDVIAGIAEGCRQAGCALIGGETAEMPGMYHGGDYDLAGFAVGAVERENILPKPDVGPGDVILGLASSGPHSNGYSLIRKVVEKSGLAWGDALAHITGGGFLENIPRVLPAHTLAEIDLAQVPCPKVFGWLQRIGNVSEREMLRTFNCGVGMICVVTADSASEVARLLKDHGEDVVTLGVIAGRQGGEDQVKPGGKLAL